MVRSARLRSLAEVTREVALTAPAWFLLSTILAVVSGLSSVVAALVLGSIVDGGGDLGTTAVVVLAMTLSVPMLSAEITEMTREHLARIGEARLDVEYVTALVSADPEQLADANFQNALSLGRSSLSHRLRIGGSAAAEFLRLGVSVVAFVAAIARLSPSIAMVLVLPMPAWFAVEWFLVRRRIELAGAIAGPERRASFLTVSAMQPALVGELVVSDTREWYSDTFGRTRRHTLSLRSRYARIDAVGAAILGLILLALAVAVVMLTSQGIRAGSLSTGDLVLVVYAVGILVSVAPQAAYLVGAVSEASEFADQRQTFHDARLKKFRPDWLRFGTSLELDSVSLERDGNPIFSDVSATAHPGQVLAIVGPNGAGKTSLIRCIAGLMRPSAGCISLPAAQPGSPSVGVQFQQPVLFPESLAVNVTLGRESASEPGAQGVDVGLSAWVERLTSGWDTQVATGFAETNDVAVSPSGGEARKLALARACLHQPPLVILDEPSEGLDQASVLRLLGGIRRYVSSGAVAVVVTHDERVVKDADVVLELSGR